MLTSMLDFCLASGPRPDKAGDIADMSQAERPSRKPQVACKTGSRTELVESENRESQKEKERVRKEKGAHRLGKQSLGIKMRIVEAILHPLRLSKRMTLLGLKKSCLLGLFHSILIPSISLNKLKI